MSAAKDTKATKKEETVVTSEETTPETPETPVVAEVAVEVTVTDAPKAAETVVEEKKEEDHSKTPAEVLFEKAQKISKDVLGEAKDKAEEFQEFAMDKVHDAQKTLDEKATKEPKSLLGGIWAKIMKK